MVDRVLRLKIIPDLSELKKQLNKLTLGGGALGGGGAATKSTSKDIKDQGNKRAKEANKLLTSLKNILKFVGITAFVAALFGGLIRIMEPMFRLLSVILTLLFLPLIPILKPVLKKLGEFATRLAGTVGEFLAGEIDLSELLSGFLDDFKSTFLTEGTKTAILEGVKEIMRELGEFLEENFPAIASSFMEGINLGIEAFIEGIKSMGEGIASQLSDGAKFIVGGILIALAAALLFIIGGLPLLILGALAAVVIVFGDDIKRVLNFIIDDMKDKWNTFIDLLSNIFNSIIDKIVSLLNKIPGVNIGGGNVTDVTDAIIRPNGQIIRTDPADTLIATKTPENLLGGGGGGIGTFAPNITIQATINNELDIRRVAEQIAEFSKDELSRRTTLFNF